jgi:hypothetical protein
MFILPDKKDSAELLFGYLDLRVIFGIGLIKYGSENKSYYKYKKRQSKRFLNDD